MRYTINTMACQHRRLNLRPFLRHSNILRAHSLPSRAVLSRRILHRSDGTSPCHHQRDQNRNSSQYQPSNPRYTNSYMEISKDMLRLRVQLQTQTTLRHRSMASSRG
jgi:hypothetical protein